MFSDLKKAALGILLSALVLAGGYIAYDEYTELKEELAAQIEVNRTLVTEIEELRDKSRRDDEYREETEGNESEYREAKEKSDKEQAAARLKIEELLKKLDEKYKQLPKTPETEQAKAVEISLERAKGAWAIYCLHDKAAPVCK